MKKLLLAVAIISNSFFAQATGVKAQPANSAIAQQLAQLGVTVKSTKPSPVAGLQEVITDKGVLYVSENGQFLMQGTLVDLKSRTNLTEQALGEVRQEGVTKYQDSMIVYKAKNEKGKITVFTDITCGYCRKLHRELDDYLDAGITVQYLAFPRGGLNSAGYTDLMNVWCASNPQKAMTDAKGGDSVARAEKCNAPVAEHYQLGQSFGISGTPAIILQDGTMIPGYQPAAAISATIDALNKKS